MCDASEAMDGIDQINERLDKMDECIRLILDHLKMSVEYTPESYTLVTGGTDATFKGPAKVL